MASVTPKITTPNSEIWMDAEGVLVLKVKEGSEVDLNEVKECFEHYKSLGCGPHHKVLQLIYAGAWANVTPEARQFASDNGRHYFLASAVVSGSLAIRLLVNFFNKFHKHPVPFAMFGNEEEARKWLERYKK